MLDRIRPSIAQQLNIDEEKVTLEASFIDDLGADSLDMVELIMAIEEEFEFEVPEEEAENIVTVGDAINYIKSKINE
ncbi:MAG: acyl carrier protein [Ruminococcaceae bacterium]|nr:acyl carrier protein [Oscillospiraceae bacterium]